MQLRRLRSLMGSCRTSSNGMPKIAALVLGVEPGAVAAATLTALGSLVPAGNEIQMRQLDPHWRVKLILWLALIGEPGSAKSPTIAAAVAPVRHVEAKWRRTYASEQRAYEHALAAAVAKKKAAGKDAETANEPAKPRFRQKAVNDVTVEALQQAMAENPDGLLYLNDELSALFGGMDAYRARGGKGSALLAPSQGRRRLQRKPHDARPCCDRELRRFDRGRHSARQDQTAHERFGVRRHVAAVRGGHPAARRRAEWTCCRTRNWTRRSLA
jgi:hypothetical protein